jgi:hypothetical protein
MTILTFFFANQFFVAFISYPVLSYVEKWAHFMATEVSLSFPLFWIGYMRQARAWVQIPHIVWLGFTALGASRYACIPHTILENINFIPLLSFDSSIPFSCRKLF